MMVLIFVTFVILMIKEISITTIVLLCMAIGFFVAIIELYFSKIIVNESCVEIVSLFKKEKIQISDIEKAKDEDHELFLYHCYIL